VSFFDTFDGYPLSPNPTVMTGLVRQRWRLTASNIVRIISPGRGTGNGLDLRSNAAGPTGLLRVGLDGGVGGRFQTVQFGFAVFLGQNPSSFLSLNPATLPAQVASGTLLAQVDVAAEQGANPVANALQTQECYDVGLDDFTEGVSTPNGQQERVIEGARYFAPSLSLYVNQEGRLRVIKGRYGQSIAFGNPSFGNEEIFATTSRRVPLNQWSHIEVQANMGSVDGADGYCYVWIDGELAVEIDSGINFVVRGLMASSRSAAYTGGAFLPYPTTRNGCTVYRADTQGFYCLGIPASFPVTGNPVVLDDFYLYGSIPMTPGVPFGDLVARELAPTADGSPQASTITGTAPAGTRWQSVLTDDADVTTVSLGAAGAEDQYVMQSVSGGDTIKAVQVFARVRKSDGGSAQVSVGLENGDGRLLGDGVTVESSSEHQTVAQTFPTDPAGDAWDAASVNAADAVVRRVR
jgi:hypothetical protein